jgi:hypothetical protein
LAQALIKVSQLPVKESSKISHSRQKLKVMKTKNYLRQVLPVIAFSAILLAVPFDSDAQKQGKKDKHDKEYKEYRGSHNGGYKYKSDDRHDREYRQKYSVKNRVNYYEHPRYGRVYERFDYSPVVFHSSRDDYYYYGDHFYVYKRGVGYCVAEPPRSSYFKRLPVECERVYVNGNVFFRHGELFFQLSPRGYVMVSAPVQIRISARF